MKTMYVRQFPIPNCSEDEKKNIALIAKKLIGKNNADETRNLKKKLDIAVYDAFKLDAKQVSGIEEFIYCTFANFVLPPYMVV